MRVIKTVLQSTLWYFVQVLPISANTLGEIEKVLYRYLWDSREGEKTKPGVISRSSAIKPIKQGGLSMLHTRTMRDALVFKWVATMDNWEKGALNSEPCWY